MAVYAKCPKGIDHGYTDYLTPGREYLVLSSDCPETYFFAKDDVGETLYCLWDGCAHLSDDGSLGWERIEKGDKDAA